REPLAVIGELLYPVAPLALPPPSQATDIAPFDSVRLFVERARDVLPVFALTAANAIPVAEICRRLDGIPLAIELASARVNSLTVEQIAARLDDRFALLTSAKHGTPSHHRTLRAALDWSYGWLPVQEQTLLRRLSVFAGGCSLEAAEHVCAAERPRSSTPALPLRSAAGTIVAGGAREIPVAERKGAAEGTAGRAPEPIVDGLSSLVSKSLVVAETLERGEARYRLLETVRQYARDKLLESGEGEEIRNRHLDYFLEFAEEIEPKLHGPDQVEWQERLDGDHDNLRAALEWSLHAGGVEKSSRLVKALAWFWVICGHCREGRMHAEELLAQPEAKAKNLIRANALLVAGITTYTWNLGDTGASRRYFEELVMIAREHGASGNRLLALGLCYLSDLTFGDNLARSVSMMDESLAIARSLDEPWLIAHVLRFKSLLPHVKSENETSRKLREESLQLCRSIGDKRGIAESLVKLGQALLREHDYAGALRHIEQGLLYFRELRDRANAAGALIILGEVERADDRYDKAARYYSESLDICRELGSALTAKVALSNLAFVRLHDGNLESAKTLFAESHALAREGRDKELISMNLLDSAAVMSVEKKARPAVTLFAVFETLLEAGPLQTITDTDKAEYARYLALAREQLDQATFDAAWEEGKKMTMEQAFAIAGQETAAPPPAPSPACTHDPNALTPRERQVLCLLAAGFSDARIAENLVISRRTVSTHLTAIYGKLGVNSRSAATRYALDHHLA
ncbi:MAG: tetratricopeptide repeat protein, partial [Acidobacteriota bacterium]